MKFDSLAAADHWILSGSAADAPSGGATGPAIGTRFEAAAVVTVQEPVDGARAVLFAGSERLTGEVTVAEVLATAIDRIEMLGGGTPADDAVLDTRDFVRPIWRDGRLVLSVMPAAGGRYVPFETQHPTPCCADHA